MSDQLLLQDRILTVGDTIETPAGVGTIASFSINVVLHKSSWLMGGRDCRTYTPDRLFLSSSPPRPSALDSIGRSDERHGEVRPQPTRRLP